MPVVLIEVRRASLVSGSSIMPSPGSNAGEVPSQLLLSIVVLIQSTLSASEKGFTWVSQAVFLIGTINCERPDAGPAQPTSV